MRGKMEEIVAEEIYFGGLWIVEPPRWRCKCNIYVHFTWRVLPQKCGKRCLITTCRIAAIKKFRYRHFLFKRWKSQEARRRKSFQYGARIRLVLINAGGRKGEARRRDKLPVIFCAPAWNTTATFTKAAIAESRPPHSGRAIQRATF